MKQPHFQQFLLGTLRVRLFYELLIKLWFLYRCFRQCRSLFLFQYLDSCWAERVERAVLALWFLTFANISSM